MVAKAASDSLDYGYRHHSSPCSPPSRPLGVAGGRYVAESRSEGRNCGRGGVDLGRKPVRKKEEKLWSCQRVVRCRCVTVFVRTVTAFLLLDFGRQPGLTNMKAEGVDLTDICKIFSRRARHQPPGRVVCRCSGVRVVCDQGNAETSEVGSLGGFPGVLFVRSFITHVTITLLSCHYTPLCHYTLPIRHYTLHYTLHFTVSLWGVTHSTTKLV